MELVRSQSDRASRIVALLVIFFILSFLDAVLTNYLISLSDITMEANPVIRWVISRGDNSSLLLYFWKFIILAFVSFTTYKCIGSKYETRWYRILVGANALMMAVVVWSVYLVNVI